MKATPFSHPGHCSITGFNLQTATPEDKEDFETVESKKDTTVKVAQIQGVDLVFRIFKDHLKLISKKVENESKSKNNDFQTDTEKL